MHYGVSNSADIYIRGSYLLSIKQEKDLEGLQSDFEHKMLDSWVGFNYELLKDDSPIGLLAYMEAAAFEKNINKSSYFRSLQIGTTVYKSIDPIVLILNAAYRYSHKRNDDNGYYIPGDIIFVQPNIGFAANEWVTLSLGFQWLHQRDSNISDTEKGLHKSFLQPTFGISYGFARGNILSLNFKAAAQRDSNSNVLLHWAYIF